MERKKNKIAFQMNAEHTRIHNTDKHFAPATVTLTR